MKRENICVIIALMITVCSTAPVSDDANVIPTNVVPTPEDSDGLHLWPGGTVYYKFDPSFDEVGRDMVEDVMLDIESKSCIYFEDRERKFGPDYVLITADGGGIGNGTDCYSQLHSQLGRTTGPQRLSLGTACLTPELVLHELFHTLGLDTKSKQENNQKAFTISDQVEIAVAYNCDIGQEVLVEALSDSNQKIENLEEEDKKTRQELTNVKEKMEEISNKEKKTNKKFDNIEKLLLDLTTKAKDADAELAKLKGKGYHCARQDRAATVGGPVTYDASYLSSGPGAIDLSTGQFSAPHNGIYTITYSLWAHNNAGDSRVVLYLRKNEQLITGTGHNSYYRGPSGYVSDQGGRTMIVQLAGGDKVDLFCQDCSAYINHVTFCIAEE